MKKLSVVFAAAWLAQAAVAAGPGEAITSGNSVQSWARPGAEASAREVVKPAPASASAASAPVRLTDAEMDEVVAGLAYLFLPSGELKPLYRAGGTNVVRVIRTPGACLVFNGGGSC